MTKRILAAVCLLFVGVLLPWWVAVLFGAILVLSFENFLEILVVFLILDFIFASSSDILFVGLYFVLACALYLILNFSKRFLR